MGWISIASLLTATLAADPASNAEDLVNSQALAKAGLVQYWQCPIPLRAGDEINALSLEDENLYAVTKGGAVYVIDADVGLVRWSAVLAEPPFSVFRPTHTRSEDPNMAVRAIVATPTIVWVYHRRTGQLIAQVSLPFSACGPAISDGRFICVGGADGRYFCLKAVPEKITLTSPVRMGLRWHAAVILTDGKRLYHEASSEAKAKEWQEATVASLGGFNSTRHIGVVRWQLGTDGAVVASAGMMGKNIYIPSDGGAFFACTLSDKIKRWELRAAGPIITDPIVTKTGVFFASMDKCVYGLDRLEGTRLWQCHLPVPLAQSGYLGRKLLYQPGEPSGVYAIDPTSGKLVWSCPTATQFLAEGESVAYLLEPQTAIHQVNPSDGKVLLSIETPGVGFSAGNTRDATLYLAAASGRLLCVRPRYVPYLRRAQFDVAMEQTSVPRPAAASKPTTAPKAARRSVVKEDDDPFRSQNPLPPAVDVQVRSSKE